MRRYTRTEGASNPYNTNQYRKFWKAVLRQLVKDATTKRRKKIELSLMEDSINWINDNRYDFDALCGVANVSTESVIKYINNHKNNVKKII